MQLVKPQTQNQNVFSADRWLLAATLAIGHVCAQTAQGTVISPIQDSRFAISGTKSALAVSVKQPLVRYPEKAELGFSLPGRIDAIHVEEGERVERGVIVANLKNAKETAELELQRAKAISGDAIRTARVRVQATSQALASGEKANEQIPNSIPAEEIARLKLEFDLAQAELKERELDQRLAKLELQVLIESLEETKLRAPFTGTITRRFLSPGSTVDGNRPVVQITGTERIRLEGYVTQEDAKRIRPGDCVTVRRATGEEHEFKLRFVDVSAQQVQKLVRIWAEAKVPDGMIEGEAVTAQVVSKK